MEIGNLKMVFILTIGFALAGIFGYISQRIKLSPILGYLLAGYLIGPYSPGYVADLRIAEQLAEMGVILMLFGVGLHFKWEDLLDVKNIAVPGAIIQTLTSAILGTIIIYAIGWHIQAGIIIGLAIGVASTVVLVRMLSENNLLNTIQGHIAVGWLIVEDILTVAVLIMIPIISASMFGEIPTIGGVAQLVGFVLLKFVVLILLMFTVGQKIVSYILFNVARTRSQELFIVAILALILVIAAGSTILFGTSIALGAFISGMVIGRTEVRQQAAANSLPMKDMFVVIFFLSVGMLFNPQAIVNDWALFFGVLFIILVAKPLAAFLIVVMMRYPVKIALTVAMALAQIGEFSFILAEESMRLNIIPDEGYDIIVACALISISINPLMFKAIDFLSLRLSQDASNPINQEKLIGKSPFNVLVIGYGPVGQNVVKTIEDNGFNSIIIDANIDTVADLIEERKQAVYGDATLSSILKLAQIDSAWLLIITVIEADVAKAIIEEAQRLNPKIKIISRVKYLQKEPEFTSLGAEVICSESEEINAFQQAILRVTRAEILKSGNKRIPVGE